MFDTAIVVTQMAPKYCNKLYGKQREKEEKQQQNIALEKKSIF